jgi:hypothetical protein
LNLGRAWRRQYRGEHGRGGISEYDRRKILTQIIGAADAVAHTANTIAFEQDRARLPACLGFPARLAHDRNQPITEDLGAAANVMAAAQQIEGLRMANATNGIVSGSSV